MDNNDSFFAVINVSKLVANMPFENKKNNACNELNGLL